MELDHGAIGDLGICHYRLCVSSAKMEKDT